MSGPNRRLRRSFQIPLARQGRDEIVINLEHLYEKQAIMDAKLIAQQLQINTITEALKANKILEMRRMTPGGIEVPDGVAV